MTARPSRPQAQHSDRVAVTTVAAAWSPGNGPRGFPGFPLHAASTDADKIRPVRADWVARLAPQALGCWCGARSSTCWRSGVPSPLPIRPIRDIQAELQWQEESVVRRILDEFGPTMINRRRDADHVPCRLRGRRPGNPTACGLGSRRF